MRHRGIGVGPIIAVVNAFAGSAFLAWCGRCVLHGQGALSFGEAVPQCTGKSGSVGAGVVAQHHQRSEARPAREQLGRGKPAETGRAHVLADTKILVSDYSNRPTRYDCSTVAGSMTSAVSAVGVGRATLIARYPTCSARLRRASDSGMVHAGESVGSGLHSPVTRATMLVHPKVYAVLGDGIDPTTNSDAAAARVQRSAACRSRRLHASRGRTARRSQRA